MANSFPIKVNGSYPPRRTESFRVQDEDEPRTEVEISTSSVGRALWVNFVLAGAISLVIVIAGIFLLGGADSGLASLELIGGTLAMTFFLIWVISLTAVAVYTVGGMLIYEGIPVLLSPFLLIALLFSPKADKK